MVDALDLRRWAMRALVVALCFGVIFFRLLPLDGLPRRIAGPDVMVALFFALAIRRPDTVPAWLIAGTMLLADMVFQRPPGLWAVLTLVFAESYKGRERRSRDTPFPLEWLSVAAGIIAMGLIYQIVLLLLIIPTANGTLMVSQTVMTILLYPLVAGLVQIVFGRGRTRGGDGDRMGLG